jgi:hypothetical protein
MTFCRKAIHHDQEPVSPPYFALFLSRLYLSLPPSSFFFFPGSFLATDHVHNLENVTLSTSALPFGGINTIPHYYQAPHQTSRYRLHRRAANDDVYLQSVKKGWAFRCLMDASIEEAPKMVQNSSKWKKLNMKSPFVDPLMALLEWGWKVDTLAFENASNIISDYKCAKMLDFLHIATDLKFWTQQLVSHQHEWHSKDGRRVLYANPYLPIPRELITW